MRKLDERLRKIKINTVVVDRETKDLKFNFICDKAVDKPLEEKMFNYLLAELPVSFRSVSFSVRKIVSDKELIERRIVRFARENYPSVCSGLKESDVSVDIIGENVRYMLSLSPSAADYFKANGAFERINADLDRNFCDNFSGLCTVRECAEDDALPEDSVMRLGDVERVEHRAIRVTDVIPIDDAEQPPTRRSISRTPRARAKSPSAAESSASAKSSRRRESPFISSIWTIRPGGSAASTLRAPPRSRRSSS